MNDTPKTPRLRRREAKITAILDASMTILSREGLDGLTIQRLADALDYTPGAFYRYFPSKDAILVELQRRIFTDLRSAFQELWSACEAHTHEHGVSAPHAALLPIQATVRLYLELPTTRPTWFGLIHLAVGEPRQLLSDDQIGPVAETMMALLTDVASLLHRAGTQGALSEGHAPERAVTLWSALHGAMLMRKFSRFDAALFNPTQLGAQVCRAILTGWGAAPTAFEETETIITTLQQTRWPLTPKPHTTTRGE